MDKGKGPSNSPPKKKKTRDEEILEIVRKRLKDEAAAIKEKIRSERTDAMLQKWKRDFWLGKEDETEETQVETEVETEEDEEVVGGELEGTETEVDTDDSIEEIEKEEIEKEVSLVSTEGSSTSNPKGIKEEINLIIHEEEEEEEKKPKAVDSSSDYTYTFPPPTSSTDISLDSESITSPAGDDQDSSCNRKNL